MSRAAVVFEKISEMVPALRGPVEILRDACSSRKALLPLMLAAAVLLVLLFPTYYLKESSRKDLAGAEKRSVEFRKTAEEFRALKEKTDAAEKRVAQGSAGFAQTLDTLAASAGMRGRIKTVKTIGTAPVGADMTGETAEIQIEKVTMNELVNLFYRIETSSSALTVKKTVIRKSFENPELLDVALTAVLISRNAPKPK